MHRTIPTILTALFVAAIVAGGHAARAHATAKPGFAPGVWHGTATISGTSSDGPMTTTCRGKVSFTLTVKRSLAAGGTGSWTMTMKGSGPVASTMTGTAALTFAGSGSDVRYTGKQKVTGTVSDGTISRPIGFTRAISGRLIITRAGSCKVVGTAPTGSGLSFKWTATKGTGTCL